MLVHSLGYVLTTYPDKVINQSCSLDTDKVLQLAEMK